MSCERLLKFQPFVRVMCWVCLPVEQTTTRQTCGNCNTASAVRMSVLL